MKLHVLAIGRLKSAPEQELVEDYATRARGLGRSCGMTSLTLRDFPESKLASAAARIAAEASVLHEALPHNAFAIALDEHGKNFSSEGFANLLRRHLDQGTSDLAFQIGGPDGHSEQSRERADLLLSLGAMTWPHRLVRVMLAEQIYRAVTILVKHPYHRP